jgi:hypothetical protein
VNTISEVNIDIQFNEDDEKDMLPKKTSCSNHPEEELKDEEILEFKQESFSL